MKKLIAYGKDIHGKEIEFNVVGGALNCSNKRLTEIIIPEGVKRVYCWGNQLTELTIPEGVRKVECDDNQISHLDLPESVIRLWCDKEVTGLERCVGKVEMSLY